MGSLNRTDCTREPGSRFRAIVIDQNHTDLASVKKALLSTNHVEITAETTSFSLAVRLVERHDPDFVFVSTGEDAASARELISHLRSKCPATRLVGVGPRADAEVILDCFRSGADEFLVKPLQVDQVTEMFSRLQERRPSRPDEKEPCGEVLAIWGSRGGCGTTAIACNIAHMLSRSEPTVLVDFHFDQGDMNIHLDVQPSFSLSDASESAEQLDETLIESITTKHPSGLHLLVQPFDVQPSRLSDETIGKVLRILVKRYRYVVLDIGHDDSVARSVANYASVFSLITKQDLPSLYLAARKLRLLVACGYERERLFVVINQFVRRGAVTLDRVTRALGKVQMVCVRKDDAHLLTAINQGVPLCEISRRGKAAKDIARLGERILSDQLPPPASAERKKAKRGRQTQQAVWPREVGLSAAGE